MYFFICVGENQETYVKTLANETCKALEYEHLAWAAVGRDEEMVEDIQYVGLEGLSIGVDFHPVECDDRLVVSVIITIVTIITMININIIKIITIVIDITRYEWNARVFSVEEDLRLFRGRNRFYR